MLYVCIPAYNEAPTVGLVLWRLRKVFREYAREYEVVVYDDGSTDGTPDALASYTDVLPLTVIGGREHRGYAAALDGLCRDVSARTRYPRRDAMLLMQGDFTDPPEHLPELIKRFEGGADIVVGEPAKETKESSAAVPVPVRRMRWAASLIAKPYLSAAGVTDPFGSMRLYRISLLRDLIKERGTQPLVTTEGWAANAELLARIAPHSRRVEAVSLSQRFDLRYRDSRLRPWNDALALFRQRGTVRVDRAATPKQG